MASRTPVYVSYIVLLAVLALQSSPNIGADVDEVENRVSLLSNVITITRVHAHHILVIVFVVPDTELDELLSWFSNLEEYISSAWA